MSLIGDAGWKYLDPSTAATVTVAIQVPLLALDAGEGGQRFSTWSLNLKERDVVTVEDPVDELWAGLRFGASVADLKTMLRHGLNGVTLTYYPSLSNIGVSYPCQLVAVVGSGGSSFKLDRDRERAELGEVECRLHLRRVDGGTFAGLFG